MRGELVALVFMGDSMDNFFIESPPLEEPSKWIANYVNNVEEVEYVDVFARGRSHSFWSNPNSNPEP